MVLPSSLRSSGGAGAAIVAAAPKNAYAKYVLQNPALMQQAEEMLVWPTYLMPGKFDDAEDFVEFVMGITRLLTFANDSIIRTYATSTDWYSRERSPGKVYKAMLSCLTVLDHFQVLAEMGGRRWTTPKKRWTLVVACELIRASVRGILLGKFRTTLLPSPPWQPLDRNAIAGADGSIPLAGQYPDEEGGGGGDDGDSSLVGDTVCNECGHSTQVSDLVEHERKPVIGRRTGRMLLARSRLLEEKAGGFERTGSKKRKMCKKCSKLRGRIKRMSEIQKMLLAPVATILTPQRYVAEVMHISRPIIHLASAWKWGLDSWRSWFVALVVEVGSLVNLRKGMKMDELNETERAEVTRRHWMLLMYLFRAPFYKKYTTHVVKSLANGVSAYVPLAHYLVEPGYEYFVAWLQVYSYVWAL